MRFMLKRWGSLHHLNIHFETFLTAWASSLPPQAAGLTKLQTLSISGSSNSNSWACFTAWLVWVLAHCTSLRYLGLWHTELGSIPPLASIRHLVLRSAKYQPEMLASVLQIRGLQTLQLGFSHANVSPWPVLQLTSLQSLQHVSLNNVQSLDLSLPPECTIHFAIAGQEAHSAAFLRSIRHALVGVSVGRPLLGRFNVQHDFSPMQPLLEQLGPPCAELHLKGRTLGTTQLPLRFPSSLAHLRELYIAGTTICIHLPAEMRLQGCRLRAENSLEVALGDPAALACSLIDLSVEYGQLRGCDLMSLFWQLGNVGKRVLPLFVFGAARGMQIKGSRVPSSMGFSWCACGACLPCWRRNGRL
jgi:hypothetical protein